MDEGEILGSQMVDVSQQLCLGVVRVENGVCQELRSPLVPLGCLNGNILREINFGAALGESLEQCCDGLGRGGLVERQTDVAIVHLAY